MGKIAILKAVAVSQIVYVLFSLPTPKGVIKEINALLYDFLWDNKGDKIKSDAETNANAKQLLVGRTDVFVMFLLYRVLFCNFANSSQICKTFLGLISCKCCNIVFFLSLLYVVFIFRPCKCKYCHNKCCNQIK